MIKYFKNAFKITNENIILTTPLVLFLFLLSIYLGVAQRAPESLVSSVLLLITILFMLSAFFAGWLNMVKKAIELNKQEFIVEEEKAKASLALMKDLPIGIGEYFLPFVGTLILYATLSIALIFIAYKLGMHFIGKVDLSLEQIKIAANSPHAMKAMVSALSATELVKVNYWNILFLATISTLSFITMFWAPEIILRTKNPAVAFFKSFIFTFKNFFSAAILFIYLSFINFTVSLVNAFATIHPIVYFISLLIYFYFVVYVVVLVFLYYESENNPTPQINSDEHPAKPEGTEGECPKGDSDCGANGDGQEQSGDSDSEKP